MGARESSELERAGKEVTKGEFESTELQTNAWWLHQIETFHNWSPGGVFVVFLGAMPSIAPAAAWFTTATGITLVGGEKFFAETLIVSPCDNGKRNHGGRICASIRQTYERQGGMPAKLEREIKNEKCFFEESDSMRVLNRIEALPEGSAIGVCGADKLRFRDLAITSRSGTKAHTGFTVRNMKQEEMTFPHLFELLRRLLLVAESRRLSVVVFVEEFALELEGLPDDLRNHTHLAMCSTRDNPDQKAQFLAKLQAEEIRCKDGIDAALKYIRQSVTEPGEQAYVSSFVLGAEGHWFEAWEVLKPYLEKLRSTSIRPLY